MESAGFKLRKLRTNSDALQNLINSKEGLAVSPEPSINTETCCVDDTSFFRLPNWFR